MATTQISSRVRKKKRMRKLSVAEARAMPEPLHEAIETERSTLSKVDSVLGCLAIAMDYENDPTTEPYYPDVVRIARDLVRRSLDGLDSLELEKVLQRNKIKDELLPRLHSQLLALPLHPTQQP